MSASDELRGAREQRGLSLEDLSRMTNVRAVVLRALERGDPDILSPLEHIGAYLRAYAREVGLDPKDITNRYLAQLAFSS